MSTIAETGSKLAFAPPTALSTQSISQSSESVEAPAVQSPRRPVLNRKASGLKFNQHFTFEKVIGSYRIIKKIGKGRFGLVKLGEHVTTGVQVAIKIVDKAGLNVVESNSIKTEAEVMTCLNHANVVRLLEVIETKYELALIMEYAAGGDLFDFVQQKRKLPEKEARRLFAQVVAGLAYCHRHFVVHRDIKAENILLDENSNVRIGDWGFSSVFHPGLTIETACGSLDYAAPEVLTGLVSYGPSVDIWALGVLLYFLLTGRLPFTAPNDFDIYQLIKTADFKCPKGISKECKTLLKSLLNPSPQTRISISEVEKSPWFTADLSTPSTSASSSHSSSSHHHHHHHHHSHHHSSTASSSTSTGASSSSSSSSGTGKTKPPSPRSAAAAAANSADANTGAGGAAAGSSSSSSHGAPSSTHLKRKKRSTKEKRSISDTKFEQSMSKLKSGSTHPPRARVVDRRTSAEKALAAIVGSSMVGDAFHTITEEEDEEMMITPSNGGSDDEEEDPHAHAHAHAHAHTHALSGMTPSATDYQIAAAAVALAMTPPPTMPLIMQNTTAIAGGGGGNGGSTTPDTPGRKTHRSATTARTFNTEKTKAELAVSKFIILKLSPEQLEQLRSMPQFDILQTTTKTTAKDEALITVVVATRVTTARKLLKRFEQNRRLFRWNSDTNFSLRSRSKADQQPTPPATPKRSSFKAATSSSAASEPASGITTSSSPFTSTKRSANRSSTELAALDLSTTPSVSPSITPSHSPTQARRRKKSFTEGNSESPVRGLGRPAASSVGTAAGSPGRTTTVTARTQTHAHPKGKLAKMHSWSQSEFDNAAPGVLKQQLAAAAAAPQAGSSSLFSKFFRKKRAGDKDTAGETTSPPSEFASKATDASTTTTTTTTTTITDANSGKSCGSSEVGSRVAGESQSVGHPPSSSPLNDSPPLGHALPPAPSSSPAKITSPSKHKRRKKFSEGSGAAATSSSPSSSPDDSPHAGVTPTLSGHDSTSTPPSDTASPVLGLGPLTSGEGGSPSTL